MAAHSEVGLFIDFENIRYSLINLFGQEPDPQGLMEKARRYGPVAVAYAYANFDEHPSHFRRKLEVAGIIARDVPRRSPEAAQKSSADMAMLMDIVDCLLDRPHVATLVLMTGNSDFIRAVARARHRFDKRVIIAGVPGSVSADLIESADEEDPIVDPSTARLGSNADRGEAVRVLELVTWLAQHRPYMTFGFIRSHAMSPHHGLGLTQERITEILSGFKEQGVLIEGSRPSGDGRTLRTLSLNREDARVSEILARGPSRFEDAGHEPSSGGALEGAVPSAATDLDPHSHGARAVPSEPTEPADAVDPSESPGHPEAPERRAPFDRHGNADDESVGDGRDPEAGRSSYSDAGPPSGPFGAVEAREGG